MNFSLQPNRGATGVLGCAKGGLEAFDFPGQVEQRFGAVWIGAAVLGWARQHRNPRRYSGTIFVAGLGVTGHGRAWNGYNATGGGNPGHFPKHQEAPATRGATVEGMTEET